MTAVSTRALAGGLADIVGGAHVVGDPAALAHHAVDGRPPRWLVRAGNVEEVSRLLALASAERLAVTPLGSGAALALGNPPARVDLVLDLGRLAAITEYVSEDMVASVEAGLSLGALAAGLGARGQRLALDPLGGVGRSVGGVLATNASGPLRLRHGTARDLVLGVRFVQADGTVTWGGSRVVKSVSGYEVPKLMVGSLGTLGVIVGATLRLHPMPLATGSWCIGLGDPGAAGDLLAALADSSLEPERVTLLDAGARQAAGLGDGRLALLVSFASVAEAVESEGAELGRLAAVVGGAIAPLAEGAWTGLERALRAPIRLKVGCEPRRVVAWIAEMERLAERAGWQLRVVAQAGSGAVQAALAGRPAGADLGRDLVDPLREALSAEGGSAVVEEAPKELKANLDVWGPIDTETLAIMTRIKREFDPDGILNPGRFVGGL